MSAPDIARPTLFLGRAYGKAGQALDMHIQAVLAKRLVDQSKNEQPPEGLARLL
jgi:hypothetical protein